MNSDYPLIDYNKVPDAIRYTPVIPSCRMSGLFEYIVRIVAAISRSESKICLKLQSLTSMDAKFEGPIKFKKIPDDELPPKPGIYIIKIPNLTAHAPLDNELIKNWIETVETFEFNELTINDKPLLDDVKVFLDSFWVPERGIVYIGRAIDSNTIKKRLRAFYRHKLGYDRPHRGGHWLKTLSNYSDFDVYWCECHNPKEIERICLKRFADNNSKGIIPFANLEDGYKRRKQHLLRKTTIKK